MITTLVNQELLDPYWELSDEDEPTNDKVGNYPNYYANRTLQACTMDGNGIVSYGSASNKRKMTNIKFVNSKVYCSFVGIEISEVEFKNTKTGKGPMFLDGCVFNRVKFHGNFGSALINPYIEFPVRGQIGARAQEFFQVAQEFYGRIDWAIDISDASAACFEIRGSIPASLVKHNKFDQFIMDKAVAKSGIWKTVLVPPGSTMPLSIDWIAEGPFDNAVLVAAKRSKGYEINLEFLRALKNSGYVY